MTEIKKKETDAGIRVSRKPASITAGALKLPLADRVALVKELQTSIKNEVESLTYAAKEAATIANGTA